MIFIPTQFIRPTQPSQYRMGLTSLIALFLLFLHLASLHPSLASPTIARPPLISAQSPATADSTTSSPTAAPALSLALKTFSDALPDMVERVSPGVVNISSTTIVDSFDGMDDFMRFWGIPQERKQTSLGSGFILDQEGFVLTNHHVIGNHATEVLVTLSDKRQFKAKIIGKDDKIDIALLQLRDSNYRTPPKLVPVPLGNSDTVRIAETVVAVGNPFGLQNSVTKGIISAKNRTIGLGPFDDFLQTDASINPGNSGGPLFNIQGEVIGINTAIRSETGQSSGLGFAIPMNEVKNIIPDLKRYGRVPRPWLGIQAERVTPQLQQYYRLPVARGVLVYNIVDRAPADQSGLQQGDIVVSVDGTETNEPNDIERVLSKYRPTNQVLLKFHRGRKIKELRVQLSELPRLDRLPRGII